MLLCVPMWKKHDQIYVCVVCTVRVVIWVCVFIFIIIFIWHIIAFSWFSVVNKWHSIKFELSRMDSRARARAGRQEWWNVNDDNDDDECKCFELTNVRLHFFILHFGLYFYAFASERHTHTEHFACVYNNKKNIILFWTKEKWLTRMTERLLAIEP